MRPPLLSRALSCHQPVKKQIAGDLDAIALKAIRKEPDNRYRTANEFLADLSNYQHNKPVSACRDTGRYRIQMFLKRHKQGVAIAAGILLLVVSFTVFYTMRITKERNRAELEAKKSENIAHFLSNLFKANAPEQSHGEQITALQLLQKGRAKTDQIIDPPIHATMLNTIGKAYLSIGFEDSSVTILKQAKKAIKKTYGSKSLEFAKVNSNLGEAYLTKANGTLALPPFRTSYDIRLSLLSKDDSQTIDALLHIGQAYLYREKPDSALTFVKEVIRKLKVKSHPEYSLLSDSRNTLAQIYGYLEMYDKQQNIYTKLIEAEKNREVTDSLALGDYIHNLGWNYIDQQKYQKALPYFQKSYKLTLAYYGKSHSQTIKTGMIWQDLIATWGICNDLKNWKK